MDGKKLTDPQLILSLRACEDCSSCAGCALAPPAGECYNDLKRIARERLEELVKENGQLRDATEEICRRQEEQMAHWAREMEMSLERGLIGSTGAQFDELLGCQKVLSELGRDSVIRSVPVEQTGWRVLGIEVCGRVIFGAMDEDGERGGASG